MSLPVALCTFSVIGLRLGFLRIWHRFCSHVYLDRGSSYLSKWCTSACYLSRNLDTPCTPPHYLSLSCAFSTPNWFSLRIHRTSIDRSHLKGPIRSTLMSQRWARLRRKLVTQIRLLLLSSQLFLHL